jgi:hypothetical protein
MSLIVMPEPAREGRADKAMMNKDMSNFCIVLMFDAKIQNPAILRPSSGRGGTKKALCELIIHRGGVILLRI